MVAEAGNESPGLQVVVCGRLRGTSHASAVQHREWGRGAVLGSAQLLSSPKLAFAVRARASVLALVSL